MSDRWRSCAVLGAMVAVAGCGGGGGNPGASPFGTAASAPSPSPTPGPPPAPATAEGLWTGSTSLGFALTLLVLESGDSWAVYRSGTGIAGVVRAQQSWNGSTVSGNGFDFSIANRTRFTASLSGSYTAKGSNTGTLTSNGVSSTYTTSYQAAYDQPATLAAVAGTWSLSAATLGGTANATVQVDSDGSFSGNDPGCSFSGTLSPRSGNRNAYTVSAAFSGAACAFDGQTLTGVATLVSEGTLQRLTTLALPADQGNGYFATGVR